MKMSEKHNTIMDRAKASKSTVSVRLVAGPPPEMLEHALTSGAKDELSKIAFQLSDHTVLTIHRTGLDIRPDRAIWRGTVEGTGDLVTLMWWPSRERKPARSATKGTFMQSGTSRTVSTPLSR